MTPSLMLIATLLAGGGPANDRLEWDGVSTRTVSDEASGVRLPVPLTGMALETKHFASAKPGVQMRHVFSLSSPQGEALEVGVFENPQGLSLEVFVSKSLTYLLVAEHVEMPWTATPSKVKALLFEHPRTGQQYARRTAVFAIGGRVITLSCRNLQDRFAVGAFAAALDGLEVK
jgi:hypothetical protein